MSDLGIEEPSQTFHFEGGLKSLVKHYNEFSKPLHKNIFYVEKSQDNVGVEIVPAAGIIHASLKTKYDINQIVFGDGILAHAAKVFKQLSLLEDSVIIYRVVRAPERRVFYIDVGNMPAHKVKTYLESIKNEMRQKRIPSANSTGQERVDSAYNPESQSEDYFFSVNGSSGRGSRVETLPGGENLGQIADLDYFTQKLFRSLRIPTSYMRGSADGGSQVNDGKVGIAYIEELRFANYIMRLQDDLERVFDVEFKKFIKAVGLKINNLDNLFDLKMVPPQNFALYRQAATDAELVNTFTSVEQLPYISKRYALKRYLGFTEEDIQTNELLLRQERNVDEDQYGEVLPDLQQFYDPAFTGNRTAPEIPSASAEIPPDSESNEAGDNDQSTLPS
jgi:hypothetical protein